MNDIKRIVDEFVIPVLYFDTRFYSNKKFLDSLDDETRKLVEHELIDILDKSLSENDSPEYLARHVILETLEYLNSNAAVPILHKVLDRLEKAISGVCKLQKIYICCMLYKFSRDEKLINLICETIPMLIGSQYLYSSLYIIHAVGHPKLDDIILGFTKSSDLAISGCAKTVSNLR